MIILIKYKQKIKIKIIKNIIMMIYYLVQMIMKNILILIYHIRKKSLLSKTSVNNNFDNRIEINKYRTILDFSGTNLNNNNNINTVIFHHRE